MIVERAYAKINLTLDVLYKRPDGYHEVDMVMQTIDLSDLIWLEEQTSQDIELESNATHMPLDGRNLAVAAATLFRKHAGIQKGLKIRIEKNIPIAAGLGGGSADAAAVLRGLNRLWGTGYTKDQLAELGSGIGSDVPFCVYGGCAVARGRGERIDQGPPPARLWVVVVKPNCHVSTGDVYGNLAPIDYATERHSQRMLEALSNGDLDTITSQIVNCLTKTTISLYPDVRQLKERMENTLRTRVYMSGSGPTLFALAPTQSAAQRAYNALRGFTKEVYLCRFV